MDLKISFNRDSLAENDRLLGKREIVNRIKNSSPQPWFFFLIISLFFSIAAIYAESPRLSEIRRSITHSYSTAATYQANFRQTNYWEEQDITLESSGIMYMSQDKFALVYQEPPGQRIVMDKNVYIIDDSEKTMMITSLQENIRPIDAVNNYWDRSEVSLLSDDQTSIAIQLLPVDDPDTKSIRVTINREDYFITGIIYEDFNMNRVHFSFSDRKVNRELDKKAFIIPKGSDYSIIDQIDN